MPYNNAYYRDSTRLVDFANFLYFKELTDRDFAFVVNGERVEVHKLIVKHSSDEFKTKFAAWENQKLTSVEVDVKPFGGDKVSTKVFKLFIQFVYTGSLNYKELDDQGVLELLSLADEYGFFNLAAELAESVDSRDFLNIWNVWHFYLAANEYELQELHDTCIKFVDEHAIETLNNEIVLEISPSMFKNISSRDTVFASEVEILKPLIRFLQSKKNITEAVTKDLLSTIRWSFITKSEFEELVKSTNLAGDEFYEKNKEKKELERFNTKNPRPQLRLN